MKNKESVKSINAIRNNSHVNKPCLEDNSNIQNSISKSQMNRLKKFNNTTRWLPNSAFTTFFGKPAFENYGYGNTNPTYGGLFYGNYMLSHNINPIDGPNVPKEKQVYASAMHKSSNNTKPRKPEPPRKVPDEIRNTPEELNEINTRNPIFQQRNNFTNREIKKPNLLKAKYFNSPKNSKNNTNIIDENLNEEFDINNFLQGKGQYKRKVKLINSNADNEFFSKNTKKKAIKDQVDNLNKEYLESLRKKNKSNLDLLNKNNIEHNNRYINYNEDNETNGENEDNKENEDKNYIYNDKNAYGNEAIKDEKSEPLNTKVKNFYKKMLDIKDNNISTQNKNTNATTTDYCTKKNKEETYTGFNKLKKKENPCLLPINNNNQTIICNMHPVNYTSVECYDPRNMTNMPNCFIKNVPSAGRPYRMEEALNIFS